MDDCVENCSATRFGSFFFRQPKIKEILFQAEGISGVSGNSQRNRVLKEVKQELVFFLDDDNAMHPHFWDILPNMTLGHIITFYQARTSHDEGNLKGDTVAVDYVDTAMYVIDRALIGSSRFNLLSTMLTACLHKRYFRSIRVNTFTFLKWLPFITTRNSSGLPP